jgi:hypothetical protein
MNIQVSRYTNIDKFVNNEYPIYFFTSPSGIQLIISASPNVEITSPGRWASGFVNPCVLDTTLCDKVCGFLYFPQPIKLTAMKYLKYC